ncbi:MAG: serine hydrolase [Bacteroidia bacterium]|nr:serine hydrolase [Bacteroidia bacterium]
MAALVITLLINGNLKAQSLYFPTQNNWDTIAPASLGWCQPYIDTLYNYLEQNNSKAFIVLKDGKLVLEKYFGTFTADSVWYWASAGKSLTAFMVGIAQQEGYLNITDTTSKYLGAGFTACTAAQEDAITIKHQLSMTTGLDDGVPDNYCTLDTCLIYKAQAGSRWAYHNAPYTLLDSVIETATGQSLNSYTASKLGLTGISGLFLPSGFNNVFYSKPQAMARFGLLMNANGVWNGNAVLSDTNYFNQMINTSQNLNQSYGYLWWLNGKASFMLPQLQFTFQGNLFSHAPADMYAALGKNGQIINVVPSQNLVVIRMGNAPYTNSNAPTVFNDSIWIILNQIICTANAISEPTSFRLNVFPNPAADLVNVEVTMPIEQFEIYNNWGVLLHCFKPVKSTFTLPNLNSGIYLLKLKTAGKVYYKRIIKI